MARRKAKIPHLIVAHRSAHSLALAASTVARLTPWFKLIENLVNQALIFSPVPLYPPLKCQKYKK